MINFEELSDSIAVKEAILCLDSNHCNICGPDKEVKIYLLRYNDPPSSLFSMCEEHAVILAKNLDKLTSNTRLIEVIELSIQDLFTIRIL